MDAQTMPNRSTVVRRSKTRSALSNGTLRGRLKGNSAAGRRVRDLYRAFLANMADNQNEIEQAHALNAAELMVALEQQRVAAARGDDVDVDQLVRLSNLVGRAVKRLRLRQGEPAVRGLMKL
jgi:hypothetical protein